MALKFSTVSYYVLKWPIMNKDKPLYYGTSSNTGLEKCWEGKGRSLPKLFLIELSLIRMRVRNGEVCSLYRQ